MISVFDKVFGSVMLSSICQLRKTTSFVQLILRHASWFYPCLLILTKLSLSRLTNLVDIVVIDYPTQKYRFSIIYILQSIFKSTQLTIKLFLIEGQSIDSLFSLFPGCVWFEREV